MGEEAIFDVVAEALSELETGVSSPHFATDIRNVANAVSSIKNVVTALVGAVHNLQTGKFVQAVDNGGTVTSEPAGPSAVSAGG